jgi:MSHA biogenesis protein MshM
MPFRITPDPRLVYPGDNIQSALSSLERALNSHRPVSFLCGPSGVGKTLILSLLQPRLELHWRRVLVHRRDCGPDMKATDLLRLASALPRQRPPEGSDGDAPKRVLLVDEAHNLAPTELESLLSRADQDFLMVLAGPPVLEERLAQLLDRGAWSGPLAGARLQALSPREVTPYVSARLRAAGFRRCPFEDAALTAIARYSAGVPRLINQLCATASFNAALGGERRIRVYHVEAARRDLALSLPLGACPATDMREATDIQVQRQPEKVRFSFSAKRLVMVLCAASAVFVVEQPNPAPPAVQLAAPDTSTPAPEIAPPETASVAALEALDRTLSTPPPAALAPTPMPVAAPEPAPGQAAPTPGSSTARPRVFIHYTRTRPQDLARAQWLAEALVASSFELVEIRPVPHPVGLGSVRYFFAQDQSAGQRLLQEIRQHHPGKESPARVVDFSHYRPLPRPGTLEIWLPNA